MTLPDLHCDFAQLERTATRPVVLRQVKAEDICKPNNYEGLFARHSVKT